MVEGAGTEKGKRKLQVIPVRYGSYRRCHRRRRCRRRRTRLCFAGCSNIVYVLISFSRIVRETYHRDIEASTYTYKFMTISGSSKKNIGKTEYAPPCSSP